MARVDAIASPRTTNYQLPTPKADVELSEVGSWELEIPWRLGVGDWKLSGDARQTGSERFREPVRPVGAPPNDRALEAEALEAAVERATADAQEACRDLLVAARVLQRAQDVIALDRREQRRLAVDERC